MQKVKKLPQRQCVGCRERKEKRELIRVVRSPEGGISLDFKGKKPGRGAYLCPDLECLKRARKSRALERALETAITPEVVARLREALLKRGLYCPCRLQKIEDNVCMCREFREQIADPEFEGYCHCRLYYKEK